MSREAMNPIDFSAPAGSTVALNGRAGDLSQLSTPESLGVRDFFDYSLVIDARSPREFAEDHLPGAVNLPVVDDFQYAEVGTRHRTDKHGA